LREQALAALTLVADNPLELLRAGVPKLIRTSNQAFSSEYWARRMKRGLPEGNIMDEHQNPSETTESGKDNLIAAAGDLKQAAGAKVEDLRQAAGQKADDLRSAAQDKAQEIRGAAENAWSGARSKAKSWRSEGEAYVRDNPIKAVLIALGFGLLLGFLLRK
jgi:ElaB/YqjD/DUF883 family membrane-anchored ribosome-binding protein